MSQRLRFLSWNIDMDTAPITLRTRALFRHIRFYNPDILLLQEVTETSLDLIQSELCNPPSDKEKKENGKSKENSPPPSPSTKSDHHDKSSHYELHLDHGLSIGSPYFCALLTKVGVLTNREHIFKPFISSMGRGYILVRGKLQNGLNISIFTSHMESLKQCSDVRKAQLEHLLQEMRTEVENGSVTVFAGDTNLRESEVSAKLICKTKTAMDKMITAKKEKKRAGAFKFYDAWVAAGEKEDMKFSWDMRVNTNLEFNEQFKPYARYDRAFFQAPKETCVSMGGFKLVGKEPLMPGKFVSDHWGLLFELKISAKDEVTENDENKLIEDNVLQPEGKIKKKSNGTKRRVNMVTDNIENDTTSNLKIKKKKT